MLLLAILQTPAFAIRTKCPLMGLLVLAHEILSCKIIIPDTKKKNVCLHDICVELTADNAVYITHDNNKNPLELTHSID